VTTSCQVDRRVSYPRRVRWVIAVLVPACSFGARAAATQDAASVSDTTIDTSSIDAAPGSCMARWLAHTVRFTTPAALNELNTTAYERDPYLTPDELTIYFSAVRPDSLPMNGQDIYTATRSDVGDAFGTVTKFLAGSTPTGSEGKLCLTGDGTQLFVASDLTGNGSKGATDIWFSQKGAAGFGPLGQGRVGPVNTAGDEQDPLVTPDGTALYYAPSLGGAVQQIYVAKRASESMNFAAPTEVTELADINGGTGTADPAVSADQKLILFSSARMGTTGANDIWYATRDDASGTFSAPEVVPDINSTDYDGDAHVSQDGCRLYFDSTRNQSDDWDLFVAVQQ